MIGEDLPMSNVEQFEKLVSETGAVANHIAHGPNGEELIISVRGGLITKAIPLHGRFDEDAANVTAAAERMVITAKMLTSQPARFLSSSRNNQSPSRR
jgi:hypothetical protein